MKISKSKQELARIISENGGWCDMAEWAAQDSKIDHLPFRVCFYKNRPTIEKGDTRWMDGNCRPIVGSVDASRQIKNWHQTILSRAEYLHLYPAPHADGWIEWNGGKCPIDDEVMVEIMTRDGEIGVDAALYWNWSHDSVSCVTKRQVTAYRLHKPDQAESAAVGDDETKEELDAHGRGNLGSSVARDLSVSDGRINTGSFSTAKPTIEQLAADYHAKLAIATQAQEEADSHRCGAEVALSKLEIAAKELGFKIEPITAKQEPELVITDWRDLQVGDIIEYVDGDIKDKIGMSGPVVEFDEYATDGMNVRLKCDGTGGSFGRLGWPKEWRFIRRP